MCPTGNGKISELSSELLRLIKGSYEWAESSVNFSFEDLRKGLNWLTKAKCPTCFHIEEPWCDVLKCEKAKNLQSCLICDEFLQCPLTKYHRDRYPFVIEHFKRVKEIGLEKHLEEERKKAEKGITLIDIRRW
jgi:transcription elongation factor Elf1